MKIIKESGAHSLRQFVKSKGLDYFFKLIKSNSLINKKLSLLEIGPGNFPISEDCFNYCLKKENIQNKINMSYSYIDILKFKNPNYIYGNYLSYQFEQMFDFIIDGHVFHTLGAIEICNQYLSKIYQDLSPLGIFMMETMISHEQLSFKDDDELFFDDKAAILYKNNISSRVILKSSFIENLLNNLGFKILYFCCPVDFKMIPIDNREIALETDPDLLRIICQKI